MDLDAVRTLCDGLRTEVRKAVIGQDTAVDLLLVALLSDGHVLLEGGWILTSSATPDVFKECLGGSFVSEAFSGR